jgi:hypothetical protein
LNANNECSGTLGTVWSVFVETIALNKVFEQYKKSEDLVGKCERGLRKVWL